MAMLTLEFRDLPSRCETVTLPAVYPASNEAEVATPWVEVGLLGAERASVECVREAGDPSGSQWTVQVRNRGAPVTIDSTLATLTTVSADNAIQSIDVSSLTAIRLRRSTESGADGRVTIIVTLRTDGAFDVDGQAVGTPGGGSASGGGPFAAKM